MLEARRGLRPLAASGCRPRRPSRRRSFGIAGLGGLGGARAAVRACRLRAEPRQRPHPAPRAVPRSGSTGRRPQLGIPLVPADRGREGIVAEFGVSENLSLSVLGRLGRRGSADKRAEARLVEQLARAAGRRRRRPGCADLHAQRWESAEGLWRAACSRSRAARALRADRGRRHRHARGDLRADRGAVRAVA